MSAERFSVPLPVAGLAGALFVLHVVGKWLNPTHVFLVPGTTMVIPFQLITCGLFDDSLPNLLLGVPVLVYTGSILHARWGAVELARFLAVANVLMACLSWLSMIVLYVLFRDEHFLFARLGGVSGALGALAVALRQQALRAPPPPAGVGYKRMCISLTKLIAVIVVVVIVVGLGVGGRGSRLLLAGRRLLGEKGLQNLEAARAPQTAERAPLRILAVRVLLGRRRLRPVLGASVLRDAARLLDRPPAEVGVEGARVLQKVRKEFVRHLLALGPDAQQVRLPILPKFPAGLRRAVRPVLEVRRRRRRAAAGLVLRLVRAAARAPLLLDLALGVLARGVLLGHGEAAL